MPINNRNIILLLQYCKSDTLNMFNEMILCSALKQIFDVIEHWDWFWLPFWQDWISCWWSRESWCHDTVVLYEIPFCSWDFNQSINFKNSNIIKRLEPFYFILLIHIFYALLFLHKTYTKRKFFIHKNIRKINIFG